MNQIYDSKAGERCCTGDIANVSEDDLSEFYPPPLRSPLLMMSNTAESEKFRHILRQYSQSTSSSDQSVMCKKQKTASTAAKI